MLTSRHRGLSPRGRRGSSVAQQLPGAPPARGSPLPSSPGRGARGRAQPEPRTTPSNVLSACMASLSCSLRSLEPQLPSTPTEGQDPGKAVPVRSAGSIPSALKFLSFAACFLACEHEGM